MSITDPRRGLLSAGSMHRGAACTGSQALIEELRELGLLYQRTDPMAQSGIHIHAWLAAKMLGQSLPLLSNAETETAESCDEIRSRLVNEWMSNPASIETIIERRFWYRIGLWPRFSGQPDYVAIDKLGKRALILDYKTGRIETEPAADNLQLRAEVVLLWHNFSYLTEISVAIIEPNITRQPDIAVYNAEDITQALGEILGIVSDVEWKKERTAGPWCVHCPAKAHCREAISYVEMLPALKESEAIFELPRGEKGAIFWERIKVAEKLIETLKQSYVAILETEPDALPGYILPKQGRERRYVPLPAKLKTALAEYLTPEEIDGCATFHPSKLEELLGLKQKLNGAQLKRLFGNLTRNAIAITHDAPFIRPMSKKERNDATTRQVQST